MSIVQFVADIGLSVFIIFSGLLGYIPQYKKIRKGDGQGNVSHHRAICICIVWFRFLDADLFYTNCMQRFTIIFLVCCLPSLIYVCGVK